jgi:hypothetical protein
MNDQDRVVDGFAAWIAAATDASWSAAGAYTSATVWPIFRGPDMPPSPDQCIVITPTVVGQRRATIDQAIQVRIRGVAYSSPAAVRDMAQDIHDLAYPNGFPAVHLDMGGLRVGAIMPGPRAPIVRDERGRYGWISDYVVRWRKPRPT